MQLVSKTSVDYSEQSDDWQVLVTKNPSKFSSNDQMSIPVFNSSVSSLKSRFPEVPVMFIGELEMMLSFHL